MKSSHLELPIPPLEMRQLVGVSDVSLFDNPERALVVPNVPADLYASVFDFGCGCGRIARKLLQQNPKPKQYMGIDLHAGMIKWCQDNLTACDSAFQFSHHDIFNAGFNPGADKSKILDFPAGDKTFSLILAWSVFTHLTQSQAEHYIKECARILRPDGIIVSTWFLFEKRYFPMMQDFQNALYINEYDLINAVIFDREWLQLMLSREGLSVVHVSPPSVRGFQWEIHLSPSSAGRPAVALPVDRAPFGHIPPPVIPKDPSRIGVE
jgi:SAM-dependent methyltransferase